MISLSFMISRSSPSTLTSVPFHLPNRTVSPDLQVRLDAVAVIIVSASANSDDFAFHWLFFCGVWNDQAASGFFFAVRTLDQYAVMQWTKLHKSLSNNYEG